MDKKKRKALEAAGFRFGDAEDFLDLNPVERRLVELRVALSRTVRRLRHKQHLTQQQLAAKLGSSQSRVAKLEAGSADVSLDLLFRSLFVVGGKLADLAAAAPPAERSPANRGASARHARAQLKRARRTLGV
jgi:transcriptional regulator with XRE-family HTH domain